MGRVAIQPTGRERIQPGGVPAVRQQAIDPFGGGLQALSTTASFLAKRQRKHETAVTVESFNQFRQVARLKFREAKNTQGREAFGVTDSYKDWYNQAAKDFIKQNKFNDLQTGIFNQLAGKKRESDLDSIAISEFAATKEYNASVDAGLEATALADIDRDPLNQAKLDNYLRNIAAYKASVSEPGKDLTAEIHRIDAKLHQTAIESLIVTDPEVAKQRNTEFKNIIGGAAHRANLVKIRKEQEFREKFQKKQGADAEKAVEAGWFKQIQAADRDNDYRAWQSAINNAPDILASQARTEQKNLDSAMKTGKEKTTADFSPAEQALQDKITFTPEDVTEAEIRRIGETAANREKLFKKWRQSQKKPEAQKDLEKKLSAFFFEGDEFTEKVLDLKESQRDQQIPLYQFWDKWRDLPEENLVELEGTYRKQLDILQDWFQKNPDADYTQAFDFYNKTIRPEITGEIVEKVVQKEVQRAVDPEVNAERQVAIDIINKENARRTKAGITPFISVSEENINAIIERSK